MSGKIVTDLGGGLGRWLPQSSAERRLFAAIPGGKGGRGAGGGSYSNPPTVSNLYPNQPGGYTVFLETDDTKLPTSGVLHGSTFAALGNSAPTTPPPATLQTIQAASGFTTTPSSIPTGQTQVMQHIIDVGTSPGFEEPGAESTGFWAGQNYGTSSNGGPGFDEFSAIYMSHWLCVYGNGTNLEGHIKWSYYGVANNNQNTSDAGPTQLFLIFENVNSSGGDPLTCTQLSVSLNNQAKPGQIQYDQNIPGTYVQVGHWHQMENVMLLGTAGNSDGTWKCWLDGTLICNFTNVQFISTGFAANGGPGTSGFFGWQCSPWWQGGGSNNKTRRDLILFGHTYMSGIFLRARN